MSKEKKRLEKRGRCEDCVQRVLLLSGMALLMMTLAVYAALVDEELTDRVIHSTSLDLQSVNHWLCKELCSS